MIEFRRSLKDAAGMQPVWYDNHLKRDMQANGVPVSGAIGVNGVYEGRLEMTFDLLTKEMVYRYFNPAECGQKPMAKHPLDEDDDPL